jgi:glutathione synthase/RimK-type ligase-like ATP-grasp enzyme
MGLLRGVPVQVLLLASRYDVTCDYIVSQLRQRSVLYLRLNSEDLCQSIVELDPIRRYLEVEFEGARYCITPDCLRSVLFRRPVFLRDVGGSDLSSAERFSRTQWAAFIRNLMLFQEARWVNDPTATYRAENKALQLSVAAQLGFAVPETRITNAPHPDSLGDRNREVAIKGLDTVLLRDGDQEMFGFTAIVCATELEPAEWHSAPATIQAALMNKLDIRVTVVGEQVFAAGITANAQPIVGDWRIEKTHAHFSQYDLPQEIEERCRRLTKLLKLRYGAIDLALHAGEYYFLEINPTGEWAWLVDAAGLPIDRAIADLLSQEVR